MDHDPHGDVQILSPWARDATQCAGDRLALAWSVSDIRSRPRHRPVSARARVPMQGMFARRTSTRGRSVSTRYDTDFYQWTQEQAARLREGALSDLDVINLAEEIESLGKSDRRALGSH